MDLAGINLVEQGHHDKRVEDDGEVLRETHPHTRVDVENLWACTDGPETTFSCDPWALGLQYHRFLNAIILIKCMHGHQARALLLHQYSCCPS